jgi:hypothetical protein
LPRKAMYSRAAQARTTVTVSASDYYLAHLPTDHIPPWDVDVPVATGPRDLSAAAIAAFGLLRVAALSADPIYAQTERETLRALGTGYMAGPAVPAILLHATADLPPLPDAPRRSMFAHTTGLCTVPLARFRTQKKAAAVPERTCVPEHATLWHAGMLEGTQRHAPTARRVVTATEQVAQAVVQATEHTLLDQRQQPGQMVPERPSVRSYGRGRAALPHQWGYEGRAGGGFRRTGSAGRCGECP